MAQLKLWSVFLVANLALAPMPATAKSSSVNTLLIKRQYGAALRQLESLANKGDARAQYKLGSMYRVGLGVAADSKRATFWLRKAAANGNSAAASALKRMVVAVPATKKKLNSTPAAVASEERVKSMNWLPPRQPDQQSWMSLAAARNLTAVVNVLNDENGKYYAVHRDRALLAGSIAGSKEVVAAMLESGANPNTQDEHARTPVLIAAMAGNQELLKQLLTATPDLSTADAAGITPLGYAAANCDAKIFKSLVDDGAKDNDSTSPALITVFKTCKNVADFLPSVRGNSVEDKDKDGRTIVWYAAALEDGAILNAALAAGGNSAVSDTNGYTPLHVAALANRRDTIKILLALGSAIDVQSKDGVTPLMLAASAGHQESVKLLAEQTADIDIKDSNGETALLRAVKGQHKDVIQLLLEKGANKRARSISGDSPEKLAARMDGAVSALFSRP